MYLADQGVAAAAPCGWLVATYRAEPRPRLSAQRRLVAADPLAATPPCCLSTTQRVELPTPTTRGPQNH